MARLEVVERGYAAVAAGDRETLQKVFTPDAVWHLMDRDAVKRTIEGREAVVEFLLGFRELRLEAIMAHGRLVVAAHTYARRRGDRTIATTLYEFRRGRVVSGVCQDAKRRR